MPDANVSLFGLRCRRKMDIETTICWLSPPKTSWLLHHVSDLSQVLLKAALRPLMVFGPLEECWTELEGFAASIPAAMVSSLVVEMIGSVLNEERMEKCK
jgi:hypothetical protein